MALNEWGTLSRVLEVVQVVSSSFSYSLRPIWVARGEARHQGLCSIELGGEVARIQGVVGSVVEWLALEINEGRGDSTCCGVGISWVPTSFVNDCLIDSVPQWRSKAERALKSSSGP